MMKNTKAIDKIIEELAFKDYRVANLVGKNGRPKYKKHHPYSLSPKTNEAREIKKKYSENKISEKEYKAFCLRYNLLHI